SPPGLFLRDVRWALRYCSRSSPAKAYMAIRLARIRPAGFMSMLAGGKGSISALTITRSSAREGDAARKAGPGFGDNFRPPSGPATSGASAEIRSANSPRQLASSIYLPLHGYWLRDRPY